MAWWTPQAAQADRQTLILAGSRRRCSGPRLVLGLSMIMHEPKVWRTQ
jgi:hypothetical protein